MLHNLLYAALISLLREVVCTVPGQGEGAGKQGPIKVVSGALTKSGGMLDLGFLLIVLVAVTVLFLHYFGLLMRDFICG